MEPSNLNCNTNLCPFQYLFYFTNYSHGGLPPYSHFHHQDSPKILSPINSM